MQPILLASSSPYRRALLERLKLPFIWVNPEINEQRLLNETAGDMVRRLSIIKAQALAIEHPEHLIIGSDQIAVLDDQILGKPHHYERAFMQLSAASGRRVVFKTGLCLLNARTGQTQVCVEEFAVKFRELTDHQIRYYLNSEQPYDCAGSFKCEGLGIALFKELSGSDPNVLIGLPLIRLVDMLRNAGIDPLLDAVPFQ